MTKTISITVTDDEYLNIKNNLEKVCLLSIEDYLKMLGLCYPEFFIEEESICDIHVPKNNYLKLTMPTTYDCKLQFLNTHLESMLSPLHYEQFKKEFKEKYNEDYVYKSSN